MENRSVESTAVFHQEATGSRRLMIALYILAGGLFWTAQNLYVPTLPTYVLGKSSSLTQVGIVLSMQGLWRGIAALPLGIAGGWLGRGKPLIVIGLGMAGAGAWAMRAASSVTGLALGRAMTGAGAGTWVLLVVASSSLFPPQEAVRASAMISFAGSAGSMVATAVTGSLNDLGGYSLAFLLAAVTAAIAILIVLPLREERRPRQRPSFGSISGLIGRRQVLLAALLSGLAMYVSHACRMAFVPILAKELGASDVALSVFSSLTLAVMMVSNLLVTVIVKRMGARRLLMLGYIFLAMGALASALAPSVPVIYVAGIFLGLGTGFTFSVLIGINMQQVKGSERSMAVGLNQTLSALGIFAGPSVSGVLADWLGLRPMFGITAAMCLVLGLLGASRLAGKR